MIRSCSPDTLRVQEDKNRLDVYAPEGGLVVHPDQLRLWSPPETSIEVGEDTIGVCFFDRRLLDHRAILYHPEKFTISPSRLAVPLFNPSKIDIEIPSGGYVASISFMSVQFFNLMKAHDNSDRGLRSIKIEFDYGKDSNIRRDAEEERML